VNTASDDAAHSSERKNVKNVGKLVIKMHFLTRGSFAIDFRWCMWGKKLLLRYVELDIIKMEELDSQKSGLFRYLNILCENYVRL
jgi:hypothetical protein